MNWFAKVEGRVYGPYTDEAMQGFVSEGRIVAGSQITNNPAAGFFDASAFDIFSFWAGTGQAQATAEIGRVTAPVQTQSPAPQSFAAHIQTPEPTAEPASGRVMIIMAEIRTQDSVMFQSALGDFGSYERVSDTFWLLKTDSGAQSVRDRLAHTLGRQDRMFIMDVSDPDLAWFNIGADLDRRIRHFMDKV